MKTLRTLIVDDEPLIRKQLAELLADQADFEIVGEAGDGSKALELITELRPDLVFLDVQMPEMDAFELLDALEAPLPRVVFVTAYDRYALQAFEVHAVDYLLKPFDEDRFARTLTTVRERFRGATPEGELTELLTELRGERDYLDRIVVRDRGRIVFVPVDDVVYFEAADNYLRIHTGRGQHLIRHTIKAMVTRLDPRCFARIHRSHIVNLERIAELRPLESGDYSVVLENGVSLVLSRTYRDEFQRRVGWRF